MNSSPSWLRSVLPAAIVVFTFIVRVWGVNRHFWMLGDQIRDWTIALGSFTSLPLVGPATHVGGYTIGPAFYWILWLIRVAVGPWFQNLPHAGGIGQALLQSAVDALFATAVWKRTGSPWLGLTAVVLLATAPFDLSLSATIWNPVVGSILAKAATALVLLDWHRGSLIRTGITAAVAWCAVHAYTGTIFVTLGIFAAFVVEEAIRGNWRVVWQRGLVTAGAVAALQVPYIVYQLAHRFGEPAMGAVTYSIAGFLSGRAQLRLAASSDYYLRTIAFIQAIPGPVTALAWILLGSVAIVAFRYRHDPVLLTVTLLPQLLAIVGYAVWVGDYDSYFYLSLMPAAVLTVLLGLTALLPQRLAHGVAIGLFAAALVMVPARLQRAATMNRMPAYQTLVAGSRDIVKRREPMRAIETDFDLPITSNAEFIFRILGGQIDRRAEWRAVISADGHVTYSR